MSNDNLNAIADTLGFDDDTKLLLEAVSGQLDSNSTQVGGVSSQGAGASFDFSAADGDSENLIDDIFKQVRRKQFGKFYLQAFSSQEELDEYLVHEQYGWEDDRPGICFGFQVHEHADNDYEVELMFNDLWPSRIRSLPS